jgi:hypothetical protein
MMNCAYSTKRVGDGLGVAGDAHEPGPRSGAPSTPARDRELEPVALPQVMGRGQQRQDGDGAEHDDERDDAPPLDVGRTGHPRPATAPRRSLACVGAGVRGCPGCRAGCASGRVGGRQGRRRGRRARGRRRAGGRVRGRLRRGSGGGRRVGSRRRVRRGRRVGRRPGVARIRRRARVGCGRRPGVGRVGRRRRVGIRGRRRVGIRRRLRLVGRDQRHLVQVGQRAGLARRGLRDRALGLVLLGARRPRHHRGVQPQERRPGQDRARVDERAVDEHLEVQVAPGRQARRARQADLTWPLPDGVWPTVTPSTDRCA